MVEQGATVFVGAYERDNFGDLLFLLQTQHVLGRADGLATAPFAGDMTELLDLRIPSYSSVVRDQPIKSVWVVGGEVGSTSVVDAYRMSADDQEYRGFGSLRRRDRVAELERISGLAWDASPYVPRMSAFENTYGATSIINSVGISGMRGLRGDRSDETWGAIREASYVSVRDSASSELLTKHSVSHVLAPDLIHSIGITRPLERPRELDLALVQVKAHVLQSHGAIAFAEVLANSPALRNFRIRLFAAGYARGHDSMELYEEVVAAFRRMAPSRSIDIAQSKMPLDKVDEIARCGLWIGTSLHGSIISTAYDVPRVALELDKLVRYTSSWGETMPVGVPIGDLNAAVETALAEARRSVTSGRSAELAHSAQASAVGAAAVLLNARPGAENRTERAAAARELDRRRNSLPRGFYREVDNLRRELSARRVTRLS
ncbi:polysaccharide pyruvyl transferase family protein [Cryobacterium sp. SO1]|uniref:polysaccharide pyruvyl transferase family protein n=1 Tax=Cryobacterium sp. SO1 TaxID=1897061 RepID=UPI001022F55D|nr:polysaccharide pyruvyl transferase family protein [Cryobacterium sp. SO1]RZI37398.1 hypothetical protein BJQ95_00228 [Cryobacterium sp. SO1]